MHTLAMGGRRCDARWEARGGRWEAGGGRRGEARGTTAAAPPPVGGGVLIDTPLKSWASILTLAIAGWEGLVMGEKVRGVLGGELGVVSRLFVYAC